jgi:hypothetical protein
MAKVLLIYLIEILNFFWLNRHMNLLNFMILQLKLDNKDIHQEKLILLLYFNNNMQMFAQFQHLLTNLKEYKDQFILQPKVDHKFSWPFKGVLYRLVLTLIDHNLLYHNYKIYDYFLLIIIEMRRKINHLILHHVQAKKQVYYFAILHNIFSLNEFLYQRYWSNKLLQLLIFRLVNIFRF